MLERLCPLLLVLLLAWPGASMAQQQGRPRAADAAHPCGSLRNAYGPYDYRIYKDRYEILVVEEHHFTPAVELLIKPMFQYFAADFDYTLRASPNHHRALISMVRHSERLRNPQPPGSGRSVDCYFDRAFRFAPDDAIPRMIFAGYLTRGGRIPEALTHLDYASSLAGDNAFTHYNVGVGYFEAKSYAKALEHAHQALQLGLPWTGLRDMLKQAGQWREPQPEAGASAASAPAAAASAAANAASAP